MSHRTVCASAIGLFVVVLALGCGGLLSGSPANGDGGASDGVAGDGAIPRPTKVDLLLDIDNSSSMGDLQSYLARWVPEIVARLVQPNCVQGNRVAGPSTNGSCAAYAGATLEFPPVHDLHVGVISTSLGNRGVLGSGEICNPSQMTQPFTDPPGPAIPSHNDDRAELLNRVPRSPVTIPSPDPLPAALEDTEAVSPDVGAQNFLDWFPTGPGWVVNDGKAPTSGPQALTPVAPAIGSAAALEGDFTALVVGVHAYGCGIVSPLESWYRFLVQPDPYDSIVISDHGYAAWSGVDATIVQQRHDFLRPDSLVLIVDVSDKDDEEIDVRAFGGQAYEFLNADWTPPRSTKICATDPMSPACTTCNYCQGGKPAAICNDPGCMPTGGVHSALDDPGFYIGTRTVHMLQTYGFDVQFPLGRYVLGLTSARVPDREHEYPIDLNCYQGGIGNPDCAPPTSLEVSDLNCTNPLFAASLPDGSTLTPEILCNTAGAGGPRTPASVLFLHIGGVPHQDLQAKPGDATGLCPAGTPAADCPQKDTLLPADWVAILGHGWASVPKAPWRATLNQYDSQDIDPHMIEAFAPRAGLVALTSGPKPTGGGMDPMNGGDWVTIAPHRLPPVSLEYACIFPLAAPIDCTNPDYATQAACDCSATGVPLDAVPSVCGLKDPSQPYASGTNDYTTQYYAKAYPSIRELEVARLVGSQGFVGSLCPIHVTDNATGNDPLYGFRPAITAMASHLGAALGGS